MSVVKDYLRNIVLYQTDYSLHAIIELQNQYIISLIMTLSIASRKMLSYYNCGSNSWVVPNALFFVTELNVNLKLGQAACVCHGGVSNA